MNEAKVKVVIEKLDDIKRFELEKFTLKTERDCMQLAKEIYEWLEKHDFNKHHRMPDGKLVRC